jgi:hypothetical protein
MKTTGNRWIVGLGLGVASLAMAYSFGQTTIGQEVPRADVITQLRRNIVTQTVTLRVADQRGEPRLTTGSAQFERGVEACWVSVVGYDVKFSRNTEKQINRQLFAVDPFVKIINGRTVEVAGKLGIRDGSGDWDDTYEGTITVAITAVLTDK